MHSPEQIDVSTLAWIKGEIDETLKQARVALETYVDSPDDEAQLALCTSFLHQVRGTLQMVELNAAARFAEEAEQFAAALQEGQVADKSQGFEALMQAILELPDYLEGLQSGQRDSLSLLLPLINELRQLRGEKAHEQSAAFSPELSVLPPLPQAAGKVNTVALARKLRPYYQAALLKVVRGTELDRSLKSLSTVFSKLRKAVGADAARQWVWVAGAYVEALRDGSLPLDAGAKQMLGRFDKLLKQLAFVDENKLPTELFGILVPPLLLSLTQASDDNPAVAEVKNAFSLNRPAGPEQSEERLGGMNAELKRTVSADIMEELSRVKDALDIFVRAAQRSIGELEPMAGRLERMAETLGLLHQDALQQVIKEQVGVIRSIVEQQSEPDEQVLMGIAGAVLTVESALRDWGSVLHLEAADDAAGQISSAEASPQAEAEHRRVVRQVMKEAKDDLMKLREGINAFLSDVKDKAPLRPLPALLHEVIGSLSLLSYRRVAQILRACNYYVVERLMSATQLPPDEELDALADAIMSIEYYLEAFVQSRVHPATVLDVAEQAVSALGFPVDKLPEGDNWSTAPLEAASEEKPRDDDSTGDAPEPSPSASTAESADSHHLPEVDDEIRDIFIEEAAEELQSISELLPKWISDTSNSDALAHLRRSFHTLKGSGRLVGATDLGEFAWAFENLLNRVIDGTVAPNATLFDMLERAVEALPQLVQHFKDGSPVQADVGSLARAAHEIAGSGGAESRQSSELTQKKGESAKETRIDLLPREIDPVLLEIYSTEARGHLGEIEAFEKECTETGRCRVTEPLVRALHTLQGSSRMAGVVGVADLCALLERYAKARQSDRSAVDREALALFGQARHQIEEVLSYLEQPSGSPPDGANLQARAAALYASVQHLEEGALPEDGLAAVAKSEELTQGSAPTLGKEILLEAPALDDRAAEGVDDAIAPPAEPLASLAAVEATAEPKEPLEGYDPELVDIFLEEGSDILDASEETLQAWVDNPNDRSLVEALQRQLHTLKGGARMAGMAPIGDLSHSLESTFEGIVEGRLSRSKQMLDLLQLAHDRLVDMLEEVRDRRPISSGDDLVQRIEALADSTKAREPVGELLLNGDELLDELAQSLEQWLRAPEVTENLLELQRRLEPLREQAGLDGIANMADLTDTVASLLRQVRDGHVPFSERLSSLLTLAYERFQVMLRHLTAEGETVSGQDLIDACSELMVDKPQLRERSTAAVSADAEVIEGELSSFGSEHQQGDRRRGSRVQHEMVRVRSDLLDNLVNFAGEVSIYRSRVEQQIGSFRFHIDEMDQTIDRLRERLRQVDIETEAQIQSRYRDAMAQGKYEDDFDPLEFDRFTHMQQLSRSMMESLSDLISIEGMMLNLTRESETLLLQQARVNTELQENLMHTRMVPLVENAPRLRRIVRQTCAELGKQANLSFKGAEVEMDRQVVERMLAPLEHMIRNSIAHGIEAPKERKKAGKSEVGSVVIALSREGSEVVIRISDDGAGIDLDAVQEKAVQRGIMARGAKLSDKDLMQFILESGFSTAKTLSQVAGRGVGMDVVNSEIKQLGGALELDSTRGFGTQFTVRLPLTLSVSRALLVFVGEDIYAVPLLSIKGIERISRAELDELMQSERPQYPWLGMDYELLHLTMILGAAPNPAPLGSQQPLLLAQSGDHRIALGVDGLLGSREIVVKPLGAQLSTLQDLAGATILADGRVALILDLPALIRRGLAKRSTATQQQPEEVAAQTQSEPVVMVVDDSITVRKVTERLLKRHNMKAVTAKDGVDALAVLEEVHPDVMLLDIEMPRMDGYELATHIRNSDRLRDIPIIMITSRTGEKHRQRAMDIGVDIYMGKPYTETDLLGNIRLLLEGGRSAASSAAVAGGLH